MVTLDILLILRLKEELEQLHSCQRDALAMRAIPLSVIASVCANYGLAQSVRVIIRNYYD